MASALSMQSTSAASTRSSDVALEVGQDRVVNNLTYNENRQKGSGKCSPCCRPLTHRVSRECTPFSKVTLFVMNLALPVIGALAGRFGYGDSYSAGLGAAIGAMGDIVIDSFAAWYYY